MAGGDERDLWARLRDERLSDPVAAGAYLETGERSLESRYQFPQRDDVFELQVELEESEPLIWRRLLVRKDTLLPMLHRILQVAMGWMDSHLHEFLVADGVRFGAPDLESELDPIDYRGIALHQVAPGKGARLVYHYDFGDSWTHVITVQAEHRVEDVPVHPTCIAGERACPPEDCHGVHGYAELLEALRNPGHPEHEEYRTWVGESFDPVRFDRASVNRELARLAPRTPRKR